MVVDDPREITRGERPSVGLSVAVPEVPGPGRAAGGGPWETGSLDAWSSV